MWDEIVKYILKIFVKQGKKHTTFQTKQNSQPKTKEPNRTKVLKKISIQL